MHCIYCEQLLAPAGRLKVRLGGSSVLGVPEQPASWLLREARKAFICVPISSFSSHSQDFFSFNTVVKMGQTFVVDVAPPLPRLNLTATTEDLLKSPQLFFAVRRNPISSVSLHDRMLRGKLANILAHRALTSYGCSSRLPWS
jgi:hypothetical protein